MCLSDKNYMESYFQTNDFSKLVELAQNQFKCAWKHQYYKIQRKLSQSYLYWSSKPASKYSLRQKSSKF